MFRRIAIALFLACIAAGCFEDSENPGHAMLNLRMKAVTANSMISGRTAHGAYDFTGLKIGISRFEFETDYEDDMEDYHGMKAGNPEEFSGAFQVNLITGSASPAFGQVKGYSGAYDQVSVQLASVLPGDQSVAFDFTHNGTPVRFSTAAEIELELEGNYFVDDSGVMQWLVVVDLDRLFDGVVLDGLQPTDQGVIEINDSVNSAITELLLLNLQAALACGEDENGDDRIDD